MLRSGAAVFALSVLALDPPSVQAQTVSLSPQEELDYLYTKGSLPIDHAEPISLQGVVWTPSVVPRDGGGETAETVSPSDLVVVSWSAAPAPASPEGEEKQQGEAAGSSVPAEVSASEFEGMVLKEIERLEGREGATLRGSSVAQETAAAESGMGTEEKAETPRGENRLLQPINYCPDQCRGVLPAYPCCGYCCAIAVMRGVCCRRCCVANGARPARCAQACVAY
uniref:Uncharacterized protein n=1 Tax=Chromera velia CCMP2878 TaxID=1169474 RepID=A0A0G4HSC1_9ALVE|mmetsp:Transcript_40674/g.80155  ORF Transcript_40674/g.80155 Transcript_40674/m.80155 type:complete len:225 (-) Transcript_40674:1042-1716(-)|eukprot:Cvel_8263.t1-p1 / transcript=Cvel_8263.t1 / gene=Cvel_8263 / organism=Chromera_velia_CCMP2878 / gene_product=hypothetical protein / transcript_product=hypothetical protein / location=Cvel_scaffold452:71892-72874(+) / protein_length=224 / sequence_SO=supercontig / SO=protein_coding / is_pseudo=false